MSFFIRKGGDGAKNFSGQRKRKAPGAKPGKPKKKVVEEDEEIDSEGSDIEGKGDAGYESEEDTETPEEKRLRLAKMYLAEVEKEISERKGDITVFYCGNPLLARTLRLKCEEFGFRFRKEVF